MLIQFCGAGGTGKTTTRELLAQTPFGRRMRFETIPSSARAVSRKWGLASEDDQGRLSVIDFLEFQRQVTGRYLADVARLVEAGANACTERSMIDHLSYTTLKWAQRSAGLNDEESRAVVAFVREMEAVASAHLQKVDALFYFPVGLFEPPGGDYRTAREVDRIAVDAIMRGWLLKFKMRFALPDAELTVTDPKVRALHVAALCERLLEERESAQRGE